MRRLLIVVSSLAGLILCGLVLAWLLLMPHIKALPVSDLSFRIASLGLTYVRLSSGSLTYYDDNVELPIYMENAEFAWAWNGWRPELQTVDIEQLKVNAKLYTGTHTPMEENGLPWPASWELPEWLPSHATINQFRFSVPCGEQDCTYEGSVEAHIGEQTIATATIEPAAEQRDPLTLRLIYEVTDESPKVQFELDSPDTLETDGQIQLSSQEGRSLNNLSMELNANLSQPIDWVLKDFATWFPSTTHFIEPWMHIPERGLLLNLSGDTLLDQNRPITEWLEYSNVRLEAQASIPNQVSVQLVTGLEESDDPSRQLSHGHIKANIRPEATRLINGQPAIRDLVARLDEAATLEATWQASFDPVSRSRHHLDSRIEVGIHSPSPFSLPDVGLVQAQADAVLVITDGQVQHYGVNAEGLLTNLSFSPALEDYGLTPGDIHWRVRSEENAEPSLEQLPVHFTARTTGYTQLAAEGELLFDLTSATVRAPRIEVSAQQAQWKHSDFSVQDIETIAVFAMRYSDNNVHLTGLQPLTLNFEMSSEAIAIPAAEITLPEWQLRGTPAQLEDIELSIRADATARRVEHTLLSQHDWNWAGHIQGPLSRLHIDAILTNQHGLRLPHEGQITADDLYLDWQLSDIFLLAGNPFARSLSDWPETLVLQRGRAGGSGTLWFPFDRNMPSVSGVLEAADVAAIIDTAEVNGLNGKVAFSLSEPDFSVELNELSVQRIRLGFDMGPLLLSGRYQSATDDFLAGEFNLFDNRLAVFNGHVSLDNKRYQLDTDPWVLHLNVHEIDLNRILTEYPATDIQGNGLLSGNIPIRWGAQGIEVDQGRISALPPGGLLQLQSQQANEMASDNQAMQIVVDALADFHYSVLESGVSYGTDGTLLLSLRLEGRNPTWQQGHPVNLNIKLEENLPALITSLQSANQLNTIIQERVQQRILQSRLRRDTQ